MSSTPPDTPAAADALARFSPPVRSWFASTFPGPTAAQSLGWPAIAAGGHTLLLAPTGSGKTLAAFLWAIDRLVSSPVPAREHRLRVVYVSPLRALAVDIDRNLRAPLEGIARAADHLGVAFHRPTVGIRTGDTPPLERERMRRSPPDVLITTPESLYLLLTSRARETLRGVEAVIVDEIHALAPTKRGSHLALTLERLEHEVTTGGCEAGDGTRPAPQRIALSATQRPLDEIARFLGGADSTGDGTTTPRPVAIVDAGTREDLDLEVVVPVEDMTDPAATPSPIGNLSGGRDVTPPAAGEHRSIWPAIHPRLLALVLGHRSTLVFVNSRRLAERLAARLNELYELQCREAALRERGLTGEALVAALADPPDAPADELVKAHHGSLSRERRLDVESELKAGRLRGLVATSSLELGIDMGAIDLVVQVSSPGAVGRGLQRIGRAGHQVGAPSVGILIPRHRGEVVELAVVARRMREGEIESTRYPRNPLDVLAQHIVAMAAMDAWEVSALAAVVRRAAPFHDLTDELFDAVLDLLAGRYPSEEFGELRPRIVWDRLAADHDGVVRRGTVRGRSNAQRLAVTNPGTISDRGQFGVFLPDGTRVGELDEEMVHESRPGETFLLGASTWRIEDIDHERVTVTPAPGQPGKLPFWHGDVAGRPFELGTAIGAFHRQVREGVLADRDGELARLRAEHDLDAWAAGNVVSYLDEQAAATGALPDDRTIVVERFRDELGDWRICVLSPFGSRVHAPWAMALEHRLVVAGHDPQVLWSDDGIALRLQDTAIEPVHAVPVRIGTAADPPDHPLPADVGRDLRIDPAEIESLVAGRLAGTAVFTTMFREAAGRALLLPRRMPGRRTALWQQRRRAADLLQVAGRHPTFPILLEATRELLQDVFDLPALRHLLADLQAGRIDVVEVETSGPSPFARSLLFGWVTEYFYDDDAPLAERRATALALDPVLLRELLGGDELRELLDVDVLAVLERELQRLPPIPEVAADASAADTGAVDGRDDPRARDADELHDVLRELGPLTRDELDARSRPEPTGPIDRLVATGQAFELSIAGVMRIAAAEDAGRLRDALGVTLPPGVPAALTEPVEDALTGLVARHARTHGPFTATQCAMRLGVPTARVDDALQLLRRQGRVLDGAFRPGGSGREWVAVEVLHKLKRRSLAVLRAMVEPVEPAALGRFLPAWQHVRGATGGHRRGGLDALLETIGQLQGIPVAASVLETDVLPARLDDYRTGDLDRLFAAGEIVWRGVERLGRNDGRLIVCFRDRADLFLPVRRTDAPAGTLHDALRQHLAGGRTSFWPELSAATGHHDQHEVLDALWELVWSGEVTNDTFAPVRAIVDGRGAGTGARTGSGRGRGRGRGRGGPRRPVRLGPAIAQGRWSLVTDGSLGPPPGTDPTRRAAALTDQLLERHGVLTRESMRVEGVPGGFGTVYPVLRAAEESGRIRRGYLVDGLGAAQFATPEAVELLRSLRDPRTPTAPGEGAPTVVLLAAADPAQPYGAVLGWPPCAGRPARTAGSWVVLVEGALACFLDRGGRHLLTFAPRAAPSRWLSALHGLVHAGRLRRLEIVRIDGVAVHEQPDWVAQLRAAGFAAGHRGMTYRG